MLSSTISTQSVFILVAFNGVWKHTERKCDLHKYVEKIVLLKSFEQMSFTLYKLPCLKIPWAIPYFRSFHSHASQHNLFIICMQNLVSYWQSSNSTSANKLYSLYSGLRVIAPLKYAAKHMKEIHEWHHSDKT